MSHLTHAYTIAQLLREATQQLSAITDVALLDAEILLSQVLHQPRHYLHTWPERIVSEVEAALFFSYVERRVKGEPIAYITGVKEFWSLPLKVTRDTLIPRPETEVLVEWLLSTLPETPCHVADLGTGSGAIALALATERPAWFIYAVEQNERTLAVARENAAHLGLSNISFYTGHWCNALPQQKFHAIVSNPPYLSVKEWPDYVKGLIYEPQEALLSGNDGLDAIREISASAKSYLAQGGCLLLEHGFEQGPAVKGILLDDGYHNIDLIRDLSLLARATVGWY